MRPCTVRIIRGVTQLREQGDEFVVAAMHVADDVEGTVLRLLVVPQRLPLDRDCVDILGRRERENVPESLAFQALQTAAQRQSLATNHARSEVAIAARFVPILAKPFGQIEHDRDRQTVILPRQRDQRLAILRPHVCCIDDGQSTLRQPLRRDEVQHLERLGRDCLIVVIVGNETTTRIAVEDLRRQEVLARKGGLTGAGGTDEDDEGELGDGQVHVKRSMRLDFELPSLFEGRRMGFLRYPSPQRSH
jgi:hypothetical protein